MKYHEAHQMAQFFDGAVKAVGGEEGACLRVNDSRQEAIKHFENKEAEPIGIYPMRLMTDKDGSREWRVRWSCVDIDWTEGKGLTVPGIQLAEIIKREAEQLYGFKGHIERSRSRGWHVWFFYANWIPAWAGRFWLLSMLEGMGMGHIELNPKQVNLNEDQLGNYVRLPYPASKLGINRAFYEDTTYLTATAALEAIKAGLIAPSDAERASRLTEHYIGPYRDLPTQETPTQRPMEGSSAWRAQEAAIYLMDNKAVIPQGKRDTTLYTLARLMKGLRMTERDAMERMSDIVLNQVSGSFPPEIAFNKVKRVYREQS